ncbi:MAG: hypothetical protein CR997_07225 [Acidobacteria bacterium]|nr:MAG: hypothetical protein CR997_07225 [Acidobacteriota bacterium]
MIDWKKGRTMRLTTLILMSLFLIQCANHKLVSEAKRETDKMHWDRSYQLWEQIYKDNPNDTRARIQMERSAVYASLRHLEEGLKLLAHRSFNEAKSELLFALKYDPDNQSAIDGMKQLERELKDLQTMKENKGASLVPEAENSYPQLTPTTSEAINLYFPKSVKIRDVYQTLGQNYGINILVHPSIKGSLPNLDLRNLDFIKGLNTLMVLNKHFYKIIDGRTLVILSDNKSNRDMYDNQIIKTYYLSNASPKEMKQHLKVLGDMKDYTENEELNAITLKGTAEQIAIADRIIKANDKAQAEVIVEIELLEVNKNVLRDMGIKPVFFDPANPTDTTAMYQAGLLFQPEGQDLSQIRGAFPDISSADFLTVLPSVMVKLLKENSDSKQISNPHVRVTAGKEATIQIGQSVPVPQTSFFNPYQNINNSNSNNIGDQALTTFDYRNAGIDISVNPRVHHNNEITLDFALKVTSVVGTQGYQPVFGQRIVNTTIRLKNGESSVLAGLLSNDERKSMTGFPGISDVPILGKLFSSEEKIVNQTDIILLLKPVIVRGPNIKPEDVAPYEISSLSLSSLMGQPTEKENKAPQKKSRVNRSNTSSLPGQTESAEEGTEPEITEEPESPGDQASNTPGMLAFLPANKQIRVDEPIQVQLYMTNIQGLYQGEVVVSFDPEYLQVEKMSLARLQVEEGRSPVLSPFWSQETGRASIIVAPVPGSSEFNGSGIMGKIHFRGIKPGHSDLKILNTSCLNAAGEQLKMESIPGSIEVTP